MTLYYLKGVADGVSISTELKRRKNICIIKALQILRSSKKASLRLIAVDTISYTQKVIARYAE